MAVNSRTRKRCEPQRVRTFFQSCSRSGRTTAVAYAIYAVSNVLFCKLVVGTEDVGDFVLVHLLHEVASGTAIFAGVELTGLLVEDLADSGGEGEAGVGVDVNLADCTLAGLLSLTHWTHVDDATRNTF